MASLTVYPPDSQPYWGHHRVCCPLESPPPAVGRMSSLFPVNNSKLGDLPGSFSIYHLLGYRDMFLYRLLPPHLHPLCPAQAGAFLTWDHL